jgi:malonyl-CoA/methylmalonyl-CoA synthetase
MTRSSLCARFLDHPPNVRALHLGCWHTYGELRTLGESVGGWLRAEGVREGDVVAIQLANPRDAVAAHLGCMALGAVRLPLNPHFGPAELAPILEDAAPKLAIAPSPLAGVRTLPRPLGGAKVTGWSGDRTALLFTSGTTGRPKGVPHTFAMWEANLDALASRWALTADDTLALSLPLFHVHGLVVGLHGVLLRGARAIVTPRFEPAPPHPEVTHAYGVPTYYRRWLPAMAADPASFRRLRLMVSGSDALPPALSDEILRLCGHRVLERYGMTETLMIASNPADGERRAGSVGRPLDGVEVRLLDGEVQVQGPSVFGGYEPPCDGAFSADGWFRTGDAGAWDGDGYLRLTGRLRDLVIVGGENVSPAEVERHLAGVPGLADIGCCGLPDPDLGEVVAAAAVLDGTSSARGVLEALSAAALGLSGLKRPRRWAIVESLPRNALGKLDRARLRGAFA